MKPTYPRNISEIAGAPTQLDAALTNPFDDDIYLIRGRQWWRLDTSTITIRTPPQSIWQWWRERVAPPNHVVVIETTSPTGASIAPSLQATEKWVTGEEGEKGGGSTIAAPMYLLLLVVSSLPLLSSP